MAVRSGPTVRVTRNSCSWIGVSTTACGTRVRVRSRVRRLTCADPTASSARSDAKNEKSRSPTTMNTARPRASQARMTRLVVGIPLLDEDGVRIMEVGQGRRDVRARQVWTHQHDRLIREQPRHLGGLRKGIVPERLADHGDARSRDEPHEERAGGQGQSPPIRGGGHARQQSDDGQGAEKHREREDDRHVPPHRSKWSTEHAEGVLWNTGGMYRVELYAAVRRSV